MKTLPSVAFDVYAARHRAHRAEFDTAVGPVERDLVDADLLASQTVADLAIRRMEADSSLLDRRSQ